MANWLSIPKAARALNTRQDVMYWLTSHDFISAERLPKVKGVGQRVSRVELERFRARFVFGTELAAQLGVSPRKLVSVLADAGFVPASGSGLDKCRQVFYARIPSLMSWLPEVASHSDRLGKSTNHKTDIRGSPILNLQAIDFVVPTISNLIRSK